MISVCLLGGLGNQLFQIFTFIAYSLEHKVPFFFLNKKIDGAMSPEGHERPLYLDNFLKYLKVFVRSSCPTNKKVYPLRYVEMPYKKIPSIADDRINDSIFILLGYFQSYKYFHNQKNNILRFIKFSSLANEIREKNKDIVFENTIALHFRIGDYKNIQDSHPILNNNYYISSLNYIVKKTKKDNWDVLCFFEKNDIDIVNNNIKTIEKKFPNIKFKHVNTDLKDWEQLITMSLCRHNIIANSTFSWWGAYLNPKKNIVTFPNTWFGKKLNNNIDDLVLPEWVRIYDVPP